MPFLRMPRMRESPNLVPDPESMRRLWRSSKREARSIQNKFAEGPTNAFKLMARVGDEFPLACPGCGGNNRLRRDGRLYAGSLRTGGLHAGEGPRMPSPA